MSNKVKITLVIVIMILMLGISIALLFINKEPNNSNNSVVPSNEVDVKLTVNKVTDYSTIISINDIINNYLNSYLDGGTELINSVLEGNNYINMFGVQTITYYTNELYSLGFKNVNYYYINGFYSYTDDFDYLKSGSHSFLVKVFSNAYNIVDLGAQSDMFSYANSHIDEFNKELNIKLNNYNNFNIQSFDDEVMYKYYLNYIRALLSASVNSSYELLNDDAKKNYYNIELFDNDLSNIKSKFKNGNVYSDAEKIDGVNKIKIIMTNGHTLFIDEYSPLEFKFNII